MIKEGKRYSGMENAGKWFAHIGFSQNPNGQLTRDSGSLSRQRLPVMLTPDRERYPKTYKKNKDQETGDRSYLFSIHDNRDALRYSIETYDNVLGRKKILDERRQHNSHFTFGDRELESPCKQSIGLATYSSDYRGNQETETANRRRFPRNHLGRSNAMFAQTGGNLMWFGRHDSKEKIPLSLLGATNSLLGTNSWQHNKH